MGQDTEGHMPFKSRGSEDTEKLPTDTLETEPRPDVEGRPDTTDAEGHAAKVGPTSEDTDQPGEDTEGQAIRIRP